MLKREVARSRRSGLSLALIMIDVDHFKHFNDTYGHVSGDECLRAIAGVISGVLRRPGDMVARYGGEEFAIILPNTSEDGRTRGGLCRQYSSTKAHAHSSRSHAEGRSPSAQVSRSLTGQRDDSKLRVDGALVEAADLALYEAKAEGRDRVVSARTLRRTEVGDKVA